MLKKANNVNFIWDLDGPGLLLGAKGKLVLQIGNRKVYSKSRISKSEVREKKERSQLRPEFYMRIGSINYWRFKEFWYSDDDNLKVDQIEALIKSYDLQLKRKISEAKTVASANRVPGGSLREMIPEGVRHEVWQRDGGSCR